MIRAITIVLPEPVAILNAYFSNPSSGISCERASFNSGIYRITSLLPSFFFMISTGVPRIVGISFSANSFMTCSKSLNFFTSNK